MIDQDFDSLVPPRAFSRRGFVRASVGSGFAAAVLPVVAQTQIKTGSEGLVTGEVDIPVGDFKMPAYRAAPQGRSGAPVVLVISEIFGVHEYIADVARRFAKAGYFAIAPELFVRQGDASSYGEVARLLAEVISKVPDEQVAKDLDACVAWARGQGAGADRLGVTGFCWGGRQTWLYAAHNPGVKA
ncbi:MAG: dienelactone hydrolase family protein, partial [Rubrivivax sp.]|nr:dienelactone hydrolase family protein [Rubrivivax sp.]